MKYPPTLTSWLFYSIGVLGQDLIHYGPEEFKALKDGEEL